jgi:hypothetical protein
VCVCVCGVCVCVCVKYSKKPLGAAEEVVDLALLLHS